MDDFLFYPDDYRTDNLGDLVTSFDLLSLQAPIYKIFIKTVKATASNFDLSN